jgi:hypothetical protein
MSALDKLASNYDLIPEILTEYEDLIDEELVAERLRIKGKVLERVATQQASWQFYYGSRKAELYACVKWVEAKIASIRGKHWKNYTEHYSRELNDRTKDKYIDNEQEVMNQIQIYLTFKELHERYEAVCDAFKSQGFMIRHITELRIRSLEDSIID